MAIDKFSGTPFKPIMAMLDSRVSLEDTLARFDEQVSQHTPDVIRKRLKRRVGKVRININGQLDGGN